MKKNKYWHKLDNAAKVFPSVSKFNRSNVFRLSFYLNIIEIDKDILKKAVLESLDRFEVFKVKLNNGFFWNYFSENKKDIIIEEEKGIVCKYFKFNKNNDYLFKIYYYKNKISLETFHALTDGTGALIFLKTIIYKYFTLLNYDINSNNEILGLLPSSNKELEDSFKTNYNPKNKLKMKEEKAYHVKGETFKNNFSLIIKLILDTNKFKSIADKYKITVTEYICSILAYSIINEGINIDKPIKLFIPVNLRKFFNSHTLKNFSLYIKSTYHKNEFNSLEEYFNHTKLEFNNQLNKELLQKRISSLVGIEKNLFIRITPLFIKNIFFKIGYNLLGESINTSSISNLGIVSFPNDLSKFINDIDFINSGNQINLTILSYNNKTNITY